MNLFDIITESSDEIETQLNKKELHTFSGTYDLAQNIENISTEHISVDTVIGNVKSSIIYFEELQEKSLYDIIESYDFINDDFYRYKISEYILSSITYLKSLEDLLESLESHKLAKETGEI